MNVGICVCVLLATLTSGSLSLPTQQKVVGVQTKSKGHLLSQETEGWAPLSDRFSPSSLSFHSRQSRSAPPADQLVNYSHQEDIADPSSNLNQLIAKLLSRKAAGQRGRSSITSRASGPGASHRIKDRDYVGWMDFGRRSAEEYEYSP
ncbi:cholecystokinin isoform X1 [Gadus morhua]|uniref:cholecystokinin isoform X1 n=1 Tax=Gadus morhua TaxID=8049 RepID=UPI0011B5F1D5|nr:cholecystokinin-like isoform X1 [Gadus morhua]